MVPYRGGQASRLSAPSWRDYLNFLLENCDENPVSEGRRVESVPIGNRGCPKWGSGFSCAAGRIRTCVARRRLIYSQVQLTALPPPPKLCLTRSTSTVIPILILARYFLKINSGFLLVFPVSPLRLDFLQVSTQGIVYLQQ